MMFVLLMAGIGLLLAGLLTVGLGIQMDLSFGNTLILTGAIAACTGMIMLSLWAVARELKKIALRLGSGIPLESRAGTETAPDRRKQAADNGGFPSGQSIEAPGFSASSLNITPLTSNRSPCDTGVGTA